VLSISKPQKAEQAKGYLEKENYYQKNSEVGYFYGDGLEYLAMEQKTSVTPEIYEALLLGYDQYGEKISHNAGDKDRRAGIDMTFSAPKSVSVLMEYYEATGEYEKAKRLRELHNKAVQRAMFKVQRDYAQTRIYNEKKERIKVNAKIMYASFEHDISRQIEDEIDPQLHTHNFIFSTVFYEDANKQVKTYALTNEELYKQKMYLGQFYRNEFAKYLKDEGYSIEINDRAKGLFDIEGFNEEQLNEFSGRSKQIRKQITKYKEKYPHMNEHELLNLIVKETKNAKKEIDREVHRKNNLKRMEEVGITKELVEKIEEQKWGMPHFENELQRTKLINEHITKAINTLTNMQSVFTNEELQKELLKYGIEFGLSEWEYIQELSKRVDVIELEHNVFSTQEMINTEKKIIRNVYFGQNELEKLEDNPTKINDFIKEHYHTMTQDQVDMTHFILNSQDQFIAVQGDAGTGKTYSAKAIKEYLSPKFTWQSNKPQNFSSLHPTVYKPTQIEGMAYTGRASAGLEADSGIASKTIHSWLAKEKREFEKAEKMGHAPLAKNRVLLIDEAGMVGSKQVLEIMEIAKRNNDRVIFMGDTKQFSSIPAGRAFEDMQKFGIATTTLTNVLRQDTKQTIVATRRLKEQKIEKSFKALERTKKLHEEGDREVQIENISKDYVASSKQQQKDTLIVTSKNADRHAINTNIRKKLGKEGATYTIKENLNLQGIMKHYGQYYEKGNFLAIQGKVEGFKSGEQLKIMGHAPSDEKTILVQNIKGGEVRALNVYENGESLNVYKETKKELATGEVITFTKNTRLYNDGKEQKVKNGDRGIIKSIDEKGNVIAMVGSKFNVEKRFNIHEMNYLDYGYAITDVKSQGATVKNVVIMANSAMANFNSFYTQLTRAKQSIELFTDNLDLLKFNIENSAKENSTLDYTEKELKKEIRTDEFRGKLKKATRSLSSRADEQTRKNTQRDTTNQDTKHRYSKSRGGTIQLIKQSIEAYRNKRGIVKLTIQNHKEIYSEIKERVKEYYKQRKTRQFRAVTLQQSSNRTLKRGGSKEDRTFGMLQLSSSNMVYSQRQSTGVFLPHTSFMDVGSTRERATKGSNSMRWKGTSNRRIFAQPRATRINRHINKDKEI
jgi:conjugative relaxase-like TrwC/TraI family protein